ncbi:hypothetical protein J32TS6_24720 [Virgibacillus pantothenticus]|nr:hypothetical protein J32TS6_24720 [Virgibacillus pantothenticus]
MPDLIEIALTSRSLNTFSYDLILTFNFIIGRLSSKFTLCKKNKLGKQLFLIQKERMIYCSASKGNCKSNIYV